MTLFHTYPVIEYLRNDGSTFCLNLFEFWGAQKCAHKECTVSGPVRAILSSHFKSFSSKLSSFRVLYPRNCKHHALLHHQNSNCYSKKRKKSNHEHAKIDTYDPTRSCHSKFHQHTKNKKTKKNKYTHKKVSEQWWVNTILNVKFQCRKISPAASRSLPFRKSDRLFYLFYLNLKNPTTTLH